MMPRQIIVILAFVLVLVSSARAEKNLTRPPGTTRYAAMVQQLTALLAYDKAHAGRMTLTSLGKSVKGRDLWMVTLHEAPPAPNSGGAGEELNPAASPIKPSGYPGATAPDSLLGKGEDKEDTSSLTPPSLAGKGAGGLGSAPKTIFYLCRQHGHEPASTEGALAFITALVKADEDTALAKCLTQDTLYIVPMANPDGAEAFLRHNAHDVDINRDWLRRTQPETRELYAAIQRLHPDLMTDQHELYPSDTRPDFTETAGPGSGANPGLIAACDAAQTVVQGALLAEGFPTVCHLITDTHPARLAHRYGCIVAGIPTILFETNRLTGSGRGVVARAAAHEQFMMTVLRDQAGQRDQLLAEAAAWQAADVRGTQMLASRHKPLARSPSQTPAAMPPPTEKGTE